MAEDEVKDRSSSDGADAVGTVAQDAGVGNEACDDAAHPGHPQDADGATKLMDRGDSAKAAALDASDAFAEKPGRRKGVIALACALCVVVVVVIAGFALGWQLPGSDSSQQEAPQTSQPDPDVAKDEEASDADDGEGADASASSDAEGEEDSAAQEEISDASDGASSADSASGSIDGSAGAATAESVPAAEAPAAVQPEPAPVPAPAPAPSTITVSVSIDSSRAASHGYPSSLGSGTVTIEAGSSVYDALVALGVSVGGSSSYVSSIGGLAEFACGQGSGWLYFVNGSSPGISCGSYKLSGGESITWVYTLEMGNDV